MNFQDVENRFGQLKQQRDAGTLTADDFNRQREQLKVQDPQGRWWTKGQAGDWFYHDGSAWVSGVPPVPAVPNSPYPQGPYVPPQPPVRPGGTNSVNLMIGLGIASAVIAVFFLPIVFGPLGVFFGYRAMKLGNQNAGVAVMVGSGIATVIGMILSFAFFLSM